jgi:hypothetical protein
MKVTRFLIAFVIAGMMLPVAVIMYGADDGRSETVTDSSVIIVDSTGGEQIFIEIHSTPDGIYGVDSSGQEWEFDFSKDKYIKISNGTGSTKTVFGRKKKSEASVAGADDAIPSPELGDLPELPTTLEIKKIKGLKLGSVEVKETEKIKGSIVAIGPVTVHGTVTGDVTSYEKITVTSTGVIMGDAKAPEIEKMRGGEIYGRRVETKIPTMPDIKIVRESTITALQINLIILIALLLAGFLSASIIKNPVNRINSCLRHNFIKSFLVGFLVWILYAPIFGLLMLTIVGIPVALFALPIALLIAVVLGSIAFGQLVGRIIGRYIWGGESSQLRNIVTGIIALYSFWIFMSLFMISSTDFSQGLAIAFMVIAIIIWSIGATAGVGASLLTRFGTRDIVDADSKYRPPDYLYPAPPTPPTPPPSPPPLKS